MVERSDPTEPWIPGARFTRPRPPMTTTRVLKQRLLLQRMDRQKGTGSVIQTVTSSTITSRPPCLSPFLAGPLFRKSRVILVRKKGTGTIDPPGLPGRTKHNDGASPLVCPLNPSNPVTTVKPALVRGFVADQVGGPGFGVVHYCFFWGVIVPYGAFSSSVQRNRAMLTAVFFADQNAATPVTQFIDNRQTKIMLDRNT